MHSPNSSSKASIRTETYQAQMYPHPHPSKAHMGRIQMAPPVEISFLLCFFLGFLMAYCLVHFDSSSTVFTNLIMWAACLGRKGGEGVGYCAWPPSRQHFSFGDTIRVRKGWEARPHLEGWAVAPDNCELCFSSCFADASKMTGEP